MKLNTEQVLEDLQGFAPHKSYGKVTKVVGLVAEGQGIKVPVGSLCHLMTDSENPVPAEVIGFREGATLLMPYGDMMGISPGTLIRNSDQPPLIPVGEAFLGRTIDAFGNPIDDLGDIPALYKRSIYASPPGPMERPRIDEALDVGIRAINGLLTLGKGQRVGIMAGSGVGKSTLMGMIARYTKADVNVIALVGERGREVLEFIQKDLGPEGLARSVVVVATSEKSPLIRMRAAYAATAVAEYFRDTGRDVVLMMDSVTRFAMASREIGLAAGEPPTTRGYTPSVFAQLPRLLERAGNSPKGSITGIYTVLVDGDDFNEPIADSTRSILDGHFVLTRELADQNHFPALDVLKSISRLRVDVTLKEDVQAGRTILRHLATYHRVEDMINIGAYAQGTNPEIDKAIEMFGPIRDFLRQDIEESQTIEETRAMVRALAEE